MPISKTTAEFFNLKKEDTMSTKKTEEVMPETSAVVEEAAMQENVILNMRVDSPRDMWDALGHIEFTFGPTNYDDAIVKIGELAEFWQFLRNEYKDKFIPRATPAQLTLLRSLFGGKLPDGIEGLSKEEASAKIRELQQEQSEKPEETSSGSRWSSKPSGSKWGNKTESGGGYKSRNASPAQIKFVEAIAKRKNIELPKDYTLWSGAEASQFIQENK